jgi:hypothetical protein
MKFPSHVSFFPARKGSAHRRFFLRYTATPSAASRTQCGARVDGRRDGPVDVVPYNVEAALLAQPPNALEEGCELIGGVAQALEEGHELRARDPAVAVGLLQVGDGLKELCLEGVEQ